MELCEKTLDAYLLESNLAIPAEGISISVMLERMKIFVSIAEALNFIHLNAKLIHRDMKPSNLFITPDLSIKIGDFGIAKKIRPSLKISFSRSKQDSLYEQSEEDLYFLNTTNIGTPEYIAPEQMESSNYDEKVCY